MNFYDDPFGVSSPFGRSTIARSDSPSLPPLPELGPDDQEGILSSLGRSALGGLGYIGGSLDKALGGRAIRGILGGKPAEALSLIPFSDYLGITNEENSVSGKELLGYDKADDSWGGTLAGMGTEMLLDPGTYLSFGSKALTGLGQKAAKAGVLPKTVLGGMQGLSAASPEAGKLAHVLNPSVMGPIAPKMVAEVADKPLRGLANVSVPFQSWFGFEDPIATLGTGKIGQQVAGTAGNLLDKATYSTVGRAIAPSIDPRVSEFGPSPTTASAQRLVREGSDDLAEAAPSINRQFLGDRPIAESLGMMDKNIAPTVNRDIRAAIEGTRELALPSRIPALNVPGTGLLEDTGEMLNRWRTELDTSLPAAAGHGRSAEALIDKHINYFPRELTPAAAESLQGEMGTQKFLSARNPNQMAREDIFKNLPGGTEDVNSLFVDPQAMISPMRGVGTSKIRAGRHVREKYFDWTPQTALDLRQLKKDFKAGNLPTEILDPATGKMIPNPAYVNMQELDAVWKQSTKLTKAATGTIGDELRTRVAKGENPMTVWKELTGKKTAPFQDSPLGEMDRYRFNAAKSNKSADIFHDLVTANVTRSAGPDMVPLAKMVEDSGYGNANMRTRLAAAIGGKKDLAGLYVPVDVANDAMRFGQVFSGSRELNPITKAFDSLTNLTKASQTTTLPFTIPTLLRNAITELYTNFIGGARNPNAGGLMSYLQPLLDAHSLRHGGDIDTLSHLPSFKGMKPADQAQALRELMYQHGVTMPADKFEAASIVGKGAADSDLGAGVLGPLQQPARSVKDIVSSAVPRSLEEAKPWNIRGFGDKMETTFAPTKSAQELMHAVDDMGRQSAFIAYLQQGMDPAVAAAKAKAMRMDPKNLTGFERNWMKRMIPFYGWMRTAIPGMLGEVAQNPGGLVGQSIRGTNELRQQEGLVPDFVGEGLALPIGDRDEQGNQRYLSGLGLPFEELNRVADNSPNPLTRTLQKLLGSANPLIKAPLELATNTQFYSGRHLDDLYDRTGFDQAIMNSPLGTVSRAASRFADPRKGVLGALAASVSPARITDADMNRARMIQGRRLLEEHLKENPDVRTFEQLYVPEETRGRMTPQELQLLAMYQSLLRESRAARQQAPAVR